MVVFNLNLNQHCHHRASNEKDGYEFARQIDKTIDSLAAIATREIYITITPAPHDVIVHVPMPVGHV
jgi:hypothetical protein